MYIQVENVTKIYGNEENQTKVLDQVSLEVERGEICVILGPSGSGKSTLLNVIGGLEMVEEGRIRVGAEELTGMNPEELSEFRRRNLGFVFQFYNLIPDLTVWENIEVCRYLTDQPLDVESCWKHWGCRDTRINFPPSCPVDNSRGALLQERLSRIRRFFFAMNRQEPWIQEQQGKFCFCWIRSIRHTERQS